MLRHGRPRVGNALSPLGGPRSRPDRPRSGSRSGPSASDHVLRPRSRLRRPARDGPPRGGRADLIVSGKTSALGGGDRRRPARAPPAPGPADQVILSFAAARPTSLGNRCVAIAAGIMTSTRILGCPRRAVTAAYRRVGRLRDSHPPGRAPPRGGACTSDANEQPKPSGWPHERSEGRRSEPALITARVRLEPRPAEHGPERRAFLPVGSGVPPSPRGCRWAGGSRSPAPDLPRPLGVIADREDPQHLGVAGCGDDGRWADRPGIPSAARPLVNPRRSQRIGMGWLGERLELSTYGLTVRRSAN